MSPWLDDIWNAVDIVASPLGSIDKYVAKGAVTRAATTVLSPATNLGRSVGVANPQMQKRAAVITQAARDMDITPENLLIGGLDLVAPVDVAVVGGAKGVKLISGVAKTAMEARKVSLFTSLAKALSKPKSFAKVIDVGTDLTKVAPRVIGDIAKVNPKQKIVLSSGGKVLDAAQTAAQWTRARQAAAAMQTAEAKRVVKLVDTYSDVVARSRAMQKEMQMAGKAASLQDAARAVRSTSPVKLADEAAAVKAFDFQTTLSKAVGTAGDFAGTTVKTAKSSYPWVAGGAIGAALLGTAAGVYILTSGKDVTFTDPNAIPKQETQPTPTPSPEPDWASLLGGGAGAGGAGIDWEDILAKLNPGEYDNPIGSEPDPEDLPEDPGYLGGTGIPFLDAPVDVVNEALDQIGLDSDFAEGLRQATGMGPVVGLVALGVGSVATYVVADKSGLLTALGKVTVADLGLGVSSRGAMEW